MRTFFRVINSILFAAAFFAAAYCGYSVYSVRNFPAEEYAAREAEILSRSEQTRANAERAREDTAQRLALQRADLRNNGEEAAAIAESIDKISAEQAIKEERLAELREMDRIREDMPGSVEEARRKYGLKIRELEEKIQNGETEVRICYWTLDDGPTNYTGAFLDALDELGPHVHVTFFTSNEANAAPNERELLRREMSDGHSVQNHSFAHDTEEGGFVYGSTDIFRRQVILQDEWIYEATGFHPGIFRFPGGHYTWAISALPKATEVLEEMGYKWIDWNCNLYDTGNLPSVETETNRAITQASEKQIAVILGHDWNKNTLETLKSAIPVLQERGYVFLPLFPESVTMGMEAEG